MGALTQASRSGCGDHVCYVWGTLYIEGEPYGVVHEQAHGQWLPQWRGCKNLDEGEVFLASDRPRSLDGRYWGITSLKALTAQALPVLTWSWHAHRPEGR